MIEHEIGHQFEFRGDAIDVGPISQLGIDRHVIRDCKTVVRGERKEGQYVHPIHHAFQIAAQKVVQEVERFVRAIHNRIAIGNEQCIALRPKGIARLATTFPAMRAFRPKGINHFGRKNICVKIRVDFGDFRGERTAQRRRFFFIQSVLCHESQKHGCLIFSIFSHDP